MTFKKECYTAYDLYVYAKKIINGKLPEHLHQQMLLYSFIKKEIVIPAGYDRYHTFTKMYNDNNYWAKEYKKFLKKKAIK